MFIRKMQGFGIYYFVKLLYLFNCVYYGSILVLCLSSPLLGIGLLPIFLGLGTRLALRPADFDDELRDIQVDMNYGGKFREPYEMYLEAWKYSKTPFKMIVLESLKIGSLAGFFVSLIFIFIVPLVAIVSAIICAKISRKLGNYFYQLESKDWVVHYRDLYNERKRKKEAGNEYY